MAPESETITLKKLHYLGLAHLHLSRYLDQDTAKGLFGFRILLLLV